MDVVKLSTKISAIRENIKRTKVKREVEHSDVNILIDTIKQELLDHIYDLQTRVASLETAPSS